jgi:hypothetical protein
VHCCPQGLGSVLDAVQLSFHASYAVLQQPPESSSSLQAPPAPPGEPTAAPPAASSTVSKAAGLSAYNSMDLYFSMVHVLPCVLCMLLKPYIWLERELLIFWVHESVQSPGRLCMQAVQKDATLKTPLDGDLLDLTRAFLTSRLRSVSNAELPVNSSRTRTCDSQQLTYGAV